MHLSFYKYQGTGNDFILIDNRKSFFDKSQAALIQRLCDRKFGIGADGLILLEKHSAYDFEMVYFNANGHEGSMCGNGGRCTVAFAKKLGIIKKETHFQAVDGFHEALIVENDWIELKMSAVSSIEKWEDDYILNTGSPHYVTFNHDLDNLDVFKEGRQIRYSKRFTKKGINVNFVTEKEGKLQVATYERGVEDETLSCGTGVVASALAHYRHNNKNNTSGNIAIQTKGGNLSVRWKMQDGAFQDIWLCGPATCVFEGQLEV